MQITGENFHSPAVGAEVHRRLFVPERAPGERFAGAVLMLHGLGDHLGCHKTAAEIFCHRDWLCGGVDWPGHGLSEGKRGDIEGVESVVALIAESLEWLREQAGPGVPLIFYAHSTGALFGLHFLKKHSAASFTHIWLSSPLLRPDHRQHPIKQWGSKVAARLFPLLTFDTGVRAEECRHIFKDRPAPNGDYNGSHHRVSARLGADLLRFGKSLPSTAETLRDPLRILITQGGDDNITPKHYSREFFDRIPAREKTYALLPGLLHEPLREPDNHTIVNTVNAWLDS